MIKLNQSNILFLKNKGTTAKNTFKNIFLISLMLKICKYLYTTDENITKDIKTRFKSQISTIFSLKQDKNVSFFVCLFLWPVGKKKKTLFKNITLILM